MTIYYHEGIQRINSDPENKQDFDVQLRLELLAVNKTKRYLNEPINLDPSDIPFYIFQYYSEVLPEYLDIYSLIKANYHVPINKD